MSEWVYLGLNATDFAQTKQERGVTVSTSPSPYDVPEAARLNFDQPKKHLLIEFQYIGSEPVRKVVEDSAISFQLGANSGRLYGIDVKLENIGETTIPGLANHIAAKIGSLAEKGKQPARANNYSIVRQAVSSEKNCLFAEMNPVLFQIE